MSKPGSRCAANSALASLFRLRPTALWINIIKMIKTEVDMKRTRIKIEDLPADRQVSPEDLQKVRGGVYTVVVGLPVPIPRPVYPLRTVNPRAAMPEPIP